MNLLFAALQVIVLIVGAYLVYYIWTLPERRKRKEQLRREFLLYEERCKAEQAKQSVRIAGETARKEISKIASHEL